MGEAEPGLIGLRGLRQQQMALRLARQVHPRAQLGTDRINAMPKIAATLESNPTPATSRPKPARKPRAQNASPIVSLPVAPRKEKRGAFPTKPLLAGVGIGAALALTAVALASRPAKSVYGLQRPTLAGALTNTAVAFLSRFVVRKAFATAAHHGARRLASAWPL